jgi:hypothetical protein
MGMGRRKRERQQDLFVPADKLQSAGHPFYRKLNRLLAEAGFDAFVVPAGLLPRAAGAKARRVRLRQAAGGLAAAGVLPHAAASDGGGVGPPGVRRYIQGLRLLERATMAELTRAVERTLAAGATDVEARSSIEA